MNVTGKGAGSPKAMLAATVGAVALTLSGCSLETLLREPLQTKQPAFALAMDVTTDTADTIARRAAVAAIKAFNAGDFAEASRQFNLALKLEITRSELQFLNGLTYHMMAVNGDQSKFALAEEGYKLATKFDSSNWVAEYLLGLAYLDQRKFAAAEASLTRAAIRRPDDPDVLYDLARAAYYAGDPRTADAALTGLREMAPDRANAAKVLRATSITKAALDQREAARRYLALYQEAAANPAAVRTLTRRVGAWRTVYDMAEPTATLAAVETAQFPPAFQPPVPVPAPPPFPGAVGVPAPAGAPGPVDPAFFDSSMVVVDVVLIGMEEDRRESRGVNLLNGLQLQFGDPIAGTPGLSFIKNKARDFVDETQSVNTRTVTRSIRIPSVTYSLNIANSLSSQNEILAKPSLVALAGQTSEFFSGVDVSAAAVSGGQGDSVSIQKEVGVKLRVTPEFLPNDMIRLQIVAERTFLTDPSTSVLFQFRLDTTKTILNATVAMKFGETLILGGLSERENSGSSDGVPILKDIPITNYFFSRDVARNFERSILILLTPRRPAYGARAIEDRKQDDQKLSEFERLLDKFEKRHGKWFIPRRTFDAIIERLDQGDFSDEFRTGDIPPESWHRRDDMKSKVGEIIDRVFSG